MSVTSATFSRAVRLGHADTLLDEVGGEDDHGVAFVQPFHDLDAGDSTASDAEE
jgi:hypothetical protein